MLTLCIRAIIFLSKLNMWFYPGWLPYFWVKSTVFFIALIRISFTFSYFQEDQKILLLILKVHPFFVGFSFWDLTKITSGQKIQRNLSSELAHENDDYGSHMCTPHDLTQYFVKIDVFSSVWETKLRTQNL